MRTLKYNLSNSRNCFGQLKIVALLFTFLSFWGCTDLSESTYTFINPEDYYKTEADLENGLNSVYADFRTFTTNYKTLVALELLTEHAMPAHSSKDGVKNFHNYILFTPNIRFSFERAKLLLFWCKH